MSELQRERLAFTNPTKKEWVIKELDTLIGQWRAKVSIVISSAAPRERSHRPSRQTRLSGPPLLSGLALVSDLLAVKLPMLA
jgi:hypothetical protein